MAIKRTRKRGVWARDWGWYLATVQLNVTVHPYTAIQKLHEPTGYLHGDGLESDLNVIVRVGSDEQGGQCVDQFADAVAIELEVPSNVNRRYVDASLVRTQTGLIEKGSDRKTNLIGQGVCAWCKFDLYVW